MNWAEERTTECTAYSYEAQGEKPRETGAQRCVNSAAAKQVVRTTYTFVEGRRRRVTGVFLEIYTGPRKKHNWLPSSKPGAADAKHFLVHGLSASCRILVRKV